MIPYVRFSLREELLRCGAINISLLTERGTCELRIYESQTQMTGSKIIRALVHICRFGLAALFFLTAGAKLWILKKFAVNVAELLSASNISYERWQWPVTIA